ncbi:MAG: hypothetical protein KDB07_05275, partial [Planctomycetes bacterium]|nr:hypothetical protein [Planctomycetota bacterium]
MGSWIRKWHVVLAVVLGIYLAIPKSTDAITQFGKSYTFPTGTSFTAEGGEEFSLRKSVEAYQEDGFYVFSGGDVQMKKEKPEDRDFPKPPSTLRVPYSESIANLIQTQDSFELKWPFARFKPNLGQDLAGGTSLRYKISSGDVADAQQRMLELYSSQKFSAGQVPENVLAKRNAYLAAVDRAALPDRPGDEYLLTDEEIESLKGAAAGFSESEILAIANNRAEFRRLAKEEVKDLVGDTIALLEDRLNKSGMTELNIVKAGDNEIEVKLPALPPSELAAIKSTLSTTGRLEFILLPDKKIFGTKKASEVYPALPEKEAHRHRWYDVDPSVVANALFGSSQLTYDSDRGGYVEISKRGKDSNPAFHAETWTVVLDAPAVETKFQDKDGREHKAWITPEKILVQTSYPDPDNPAGDLRGYPVKGTSLKSAEASSDSNSGRPAVSFELGGQGVAVMETVTAAHNEEDNVNADDHRNLAVAIDKAVYSAPSINAKLSDRIQVSGSFTRAEVAQYVAILKSGSLSVELTPLGEESIGPAEGQDNINRGMWSL